MMRTRRRRRRRRGRGEGRRRMEMTAAGSGGSDVRGVQAVDSERLLQDQERSDLFVSQRSSQTSMTPQQVRDVLASAGQGRRGCGV
eukprot:712400-Hanusia_phi.AAC.1